MRLMNLIKMNNQQVVRGLPNQAVVTWQSFAICRIKIVFNNTPTSSNIRNLFIKCLSTYMRINRTAQNDLKRSMSGILK